MKRNQVVLSLIVGLTAILGGYILYVLMQLPDRVEWFSLYGPVLYFTMFASGYILLLTIAGSVARLLLSDISGPIFQGLKVALIILPTTIGIGLVSGQVKVSRTAKQMNRESEVARQQNVVDQSNRLDSLNAVIRLDPSNYRALVERGLMKRKIGQVESSISDYTMALEINPNDFTANLEMGYSLGLLNRKLEQDSFYRIAVDLDTNAYFARKNRQYKYNE